MLWILSEEKLTCAKNFPHIFFRVFQPIHEIPGVHRILVRKLCFIVFSFITSSGASGYSFECSKDKHLLRQFHYGHHQLMVPNEHETSDMTEPELDFAVSFSSTMPLTHAIAISVQGQCTRL